MIIGVVLPHAQLATACPGEGHVFARLRGRSCDAYDARTDVDLQAKIQVRVSSKDANVVTEDGQRIFRVKNGKNDVVDYDVTGSKTARFETSIGRIIFNRQCLPSDYPYMNYKMVKGDVVKLVANVLRPLSAGSRWQPILDAIKFAGFHFATRAGLTVSVCGTPLMPPRRSPDPGRGPVRASTRSTSTTRKASSTEQERHTEVVNDWTDATDDVG